MMLAVSMKSPEFALSKEESETLARAASNVARHYNLSASAKAMDWSNLIMVMIVLYGGKMRLAGQRKREEKASQVQRPPITEHYAAQ